MLWTEGSILNLAFMMSIGFEYQPSSSIRIIATISIIIFTVAFSTFYTNVGQTKDATTRMECPWNSEPNTWELPFQA
jgi:hypothetical protein